ncbi:MAG TPA: NAD-dependent epimerase/dehydratase family protein [Bacteroidia bacterium]|nr:NAD-dependent epimerase/dehydratase family protein [Bacteroidia bacterium]
MNTIKVILTGATGMVGEGVLLECLKNEQVSQVLMINRRSSTWKHNKLKELIVPDFLKLENYAEQLKGYDACFFCAGISSVGMNEADYTRVTYDTTLHVGKTLLALNPGLVFTYVSGMSTDSTEKGRMMWARVKGKTENDLMKLPFKGEYNFRPGIMKPFKEQQHVKTLFKVFSFLIPIFFSGSTLTLEQVGRAMIHAVTKGYDKQVLEVSDIRKLAA